MQDSLLYTLILDGQRAFRLRKAVEECPLFSDPVHIKAWRAGYFSARDNVSPGVTMTTLAEDIEKGKI